ncbi:MAG: DUF72 domain-containing protein [Labilithrix sp.]|nr:DUF72 domain-containing protein [Labilithrix sp.]MCW5814245.1 DUF72 domain-containing protein [Labilithrix sp.]
MATRLHIGTKELRGALTAYAKRFDLLEIKGESAATLKRAPLSATLKKWRKSVPPHFDFVVVAGPAVGKVKASDALEAELEAMLATAKVLESRVIVLPTHSDVTPSKVSRDRVAKLLERIPRDASTVVWEPSGLWEHEDAAVQAKQWGVVLACDPVRDVVPVGPVAFCRLRALGQTRAYSTAALEKVARAIGERRDAYVVIETDGALKEAKTLRALVRAAGSKTRGGMGRLIRPRGAAARDDDDDDDEE